MRVWHVVITVLCLAAAEVAVFVIAWLFGPAFIGLAVASASILISVFVWTAGYAAFGGAPYVGSRDDRVSAMLSLSGLKPGERLIDLGSGDGRIVIAAAKTGARAEGWEINPYLWALSLWNIWWAGVGDKARIHLGDYWSTDLGDVDVVTLYLLPSKMSQMESKLRREIKEGSRVVSNAFKFPTWPRTSDSGGVHLYRR